MADSVDEKHIPSVSRTLRRLSLVSIGLIGLDLLVRYWTSIVQVLGFVDQRGAPSLTDIALASAEWLGLYGAVIVIGTLVIIFLAVTYR